MKHTPGPWNYGNAEIFGGEGAQTVIARTVPAPNEDENSRLICAAPELLERLELTLLALEEYMGKDGREENAKFLAASRAAIAKAKGDSHEITQTG